MFPLEAKQLSVVSWVQAEKQTPSTCVCSTALQASAIFLLKAFGVTFLCFHKNAGPLA